MTAWKLIGQLHLSTMYTDHRICNPAIERIRRDRRRSCCGSADGIRNWRHWISQISSGGPEATLARGSWPWWPRRRSGGVPAAIPPAAPAAGFPPAGCRRSRPEATGWVVGEDADQPCEASLITSLPPVRPSSHGEDDRPRADLQGLAQPAAGFEDRGSRAGSCRPAFTASGRPSL